MPSVRASSPVLVLGDPDDYFSHYSRCLSSGRSHTWLRCGQQWWCSVSPVIGIIMLRHGCGYALANAGHDTRALQAWLGHKNIQHTVRYTELSPERFRDFWKD
jgi:type 1 fimbriae regulatory protein FimB/type 1 fimbriae regulatory protein FimE